MSSTSSLADLFAWRNLQGHATAAPPFQCRRGHDAATFLCSGCLVSQPCRHPKTRSYDMAERLLALRSVVRAVLRELQAACTCGPHCCGNRGRCSHLAPSEDYTNPWGRQHVVYSYRLPAGRSLRIAWMPALFVLRLQLIDSNIAVLRCSGLLLWYRSPLSGLCAGRLQIWTFWPGFLQICPTRVHSPEISAARFRAFWLALLAAVGLSTPNGVRHEFLHESHVVSMLLVFHGRWGSNIRKAAIAPRRQLQDCRQWPRGRSQWAALCGHGNCLR